MITLSHAKAWVKNGFDVVWFAEKFKDSQPYEIIDGIHVYRIGVEHSIHNFLAPVTYGLFLMHAIWMYWLRFRGVFDLVIDEVHGPIYWITLWAWRSKKLIYVHEVAQNIWDKMLPWPLNIVGKTVERIMYVVYTKVPFLTASLSTRDDLVAFGVPPERITVIPHGIDIPIADKIEKKGKKLQLIFVARLVKMKGVEDAIEVVSTITKRIPDVKLYVVGSGEPDYVSKLRTRVHQLKIEKNIEFTGFIDRAKQIELYRKAHFLIHTSVREGFGLVVLEANSQGTPAIVYDSPGLRDIVVNGVNGYISPLGEPEVLADTIVRLYTEADDYALLQKTSRNQAKLYKWDAITRMSSNYITLCIEK